MFPKMLYQRSAGNNREVLAEGALFNKTKNYDLQEDR
jgi:hypothetical protein